MDLIERLTLSILFFLQNDSETCKLDILSNFANSNKEVSNIVFDMESNEINIVLYGFD